MDKNLEIAASYLLELAYLFEMDNSIIESRFTHYEDFCKAIVSQAENIKFQSDEYEKQKLTGYTRYRR